VTIRSKFFDSKNNSLKTFYTKGILEKMTSEECFGDFWEDIFSLKITTKKDEKERLMIQDNVKSHNLVNGFKTETPVGKKLAESGFANYLRRVMLFHSTPKVNLLG